MPPKNDKKKMTKKKDNTNTLTKTQSGRRIFFFVYFQIFKVHCFGNGDFTNQKYYQVKLQNYARLVEWFEHSRSVQHFFLISSVYDFSVT